MLSLTWEYILYIHIHIQCVRICIYLTLYASVCIPILQSWIRFQLYVSIIWRYIHMPWIRFNMVIFDLCFHRKKPNHKIETTAKYEIVLTTRSGAVQCCKAIQPEINKIIWPNDMQDKRSLQNTRLHNQMQHITNMLTNIHNLLTSVWSPIDS